MTWIITATSHLWEDQDLFIYLSRLIFQELFVSSCWLQLTKLTKWNAALGNKINLGVFLPRNLATATLARLYSLRLTGEGFAGRRGLSGDVNVGGRRDVTLTGSRGRRAGIFSVLFLDLCRYVTSSVQFSLRLILWFVLLWSPTCTELFGLFFFTCVIIKHPEMIQKGGSVLSYTS